MGEQFYLHKPDFNILTSNDDIHSNSRNVTSKILAEADNVLDVIRKIEEYNSDNNLSHNKRINYSIGLTSKVYLSVLKAYFVNDDKSLVVVTSEANGHTSLEYEKNSKEYPKMTSGKNAVSTHIIPIEEIVDIVFGSYDPEKVKIFEDIKEINNMSEREAVRILTELLNDMNTLNSAGMYKDFIKKFNIVFNKYALDTVDYNYNLYAYNIYVKVVSLYLTVIKEIYTSYEYYSKNSNKDYRNRFIFMDIVDIDSLQVILENQNDRRAENTLLEQIVFGYEDLEILAKILEIEFIELDVEFNIENMNPEKNNRVYKKSIIIDASSGIEYTPTPSGPTGPVDPTIPNNPDPEPDPIEKIAYIKVRKVEGNSYGTHPAQIDVFGVEYYTDNSNSEVINVTEDTSTDDNTQTMMNNSLNTFYTNNNIPNEIRINIQNNMPANGTEYEFVYLFSLTGSVRLQKANDWKAVNKGYLWYHDTVLRPNPVWKNTLKIAHIKARKVEGNSYGTHPAQIDVFGVEYYTDNSSKSVINVTEDTSTDDNTQTMMNNSLNTFYTNNNIPNEIRINIQNNMPANGTEYEFVYVFSLTGSVEMAKANDWVEMNDGYLWYHDTVLRQNPVWKNTLKIDLIRVRHLNNPSNWEYTHPSQVLVYGTQYTNDGSNKNVIPEANPYGDKISQTLLDDALNSYYTAQKVSTSSTVRIQTRDMPNNVNPLPTYEWVIMTDVSGYTKRYTKIEWARSGDNPYGGRVPRPKIWKSAEFVGYPEWGTFDTIKTAQIKLYTGHFEVFEYRSTYPYIKNYIDCNPTVVVKTNNLIMNINSLKTGILTSKSLSTAAADEDSWALAIEGVQGEFGKDMEQAANNAAKTGEASDVSSEDLTLKVVSMANDSISGSSSNVFRNKGYVNPTLTDFYTSNSIGTTDQLPMSSTPTLKTPIWSYSDNRIYCKYPNSLDTPMLRYTYNYNFPYYGSPTCTRTQNDDESLRYPDPTIPDPEPASIEKIAYMKVRHSNDESGNNLYPNQLVLYAIEIDENNMGESIVYDKDLSWEDSSQTMLNSMLNNWYTDNNIPLVNRINVSTFNSEFTDNEFVYVFNDDNTVEFHQFDDWVEMNDGYIWKSNELDTIDSPGWSEVTVKKQTTFDVCSRYTFDQYKSNFIYKTKTGIIQSVERYSDITTGQPLDNSNIFIENNNLPVIDNQSFRNEMGYVKEQFMSLLVSLKEIHYYSWDNAMDARNSALKSSTLSSFTAHYENMMIYLNRICDMSGPTRDNINTFISYLNTVTTTKAYVTSNYNTQFNEIISGMNTFLSGFISSLGTHNTSYRSKVTKFRDILSNILNRPSLESMKFYLNGTEVTDYISVIEDLRLPTASYYGGTTDTDPVYILLRNGIDLDQIITSTSINNAIPSILSTLNSSTDLTSWYNNNELSSNDYIQGLSVDIYKQTPSISTPPNVSSPEDDIDISIRYTFNIDGTVNKEFIDID